MLIYRICLSKIDYPHSTVKVFRKSRYKSTTMQKEYYKVNDNNASSKQEYRENAFKIQMISKNLHEQIFGKSSQFVNIKESLLLKHLDELKKFGIDINKSTILPDIKLKIPPLRGKNIEDHFHIIANEQIKPYVNLMNELINCKKYPIPPTKWCFQEGWTKYNPLNNSALPVKYPSDDVFIIDVEVCVSLGNAPIIATAVSSQYWYSWVSPKVFSENSACGNLEVCNLDELIPLGKEGPKLIVGHNVSYDRARIREQYFLEDTKSRFIDTMSMHICVSGVSSYQRTIIKSKNRSDTNNEWIEKSSLNSLKDVYKLYCKEEMHSKETRNVFLKGTIDDIRKNFQHLMSYCSNDVIITSKILQKLVPLFLERFPHPVTFAGMLELGSSYLPVNDNWIRYINESKLAYEGLNIELKKHLSMRANEACKWFNNDKYKNHIWLWDEDWSVQKLKMKVNSKEKQMKSTKRNNIPNIHMRDLFQKFEYLHGMKKLLPKKRPFLPGYPAWYRKLSRKPQEGFVCFSGANEIGIGMNIVPKLLSLCWEGYPLHYNKEHGWGFLVPFKLKHSQTNSQEGKIPIHELASFCQIQNIDFESVLENVHNFKQNLTIKSGIWCNTVIDDCCYFFKLPHKKGSSFRVGNPLSKDFLKEVSNNILSSGNNTDTAERIIEISRMVTYWRNNRDRIIGQMVVWLPTSTTHSEFKYGAICPQIVVCGTVTRRAMEPTWMTASNSQIERIGSELRAMVQAPMNYKIIGADVDSQELWIASVLGDAYSCGTHGATPLGWMTLSGSKHNGTDMHSITAKAIGISRENAKVINYARIYGAGQKFAESLLKQFNPSISDLDAKSKALKMYSITKGRRNYEIRKEFQDQYEKKGYSTNEALKISSMCNRIVHEMFLKPSWKGGTESAMFNRLEHIASKESPVTPFLGCRLSRALEGTGGNETQFLPTRVNWVVQSGAVDFLHLMLVSMRWLMGYNVRFCLSFHDELRYLVKDELAYKAALAMHTTNLLTRSFCSSRLGLYDLPMSVAFFSSVEIDTVLRKECTMDCVTPSNPHGLKIGYGIPHGESLNIYEAIEKVGGDISNWDWIV